MTSPDSAPVVARPTCPFRSALEQFLAALVLSLLFIVSSVVLLFTSHFILTWGFIIASLCAYGYAWHLDRKLARHQTEL